VFPIAERDVQRARHIVLGSLRLSARDASRGFRDGLEALS